MTFRKFYRSLAITGVVLLVGTLLFGLLLWIPPLIYPNDCNSSGHCGHLIVEASLSLGFRFIFIAPIIMLLGVLLLILSGAIYGISFIKHNAETGFLNRRIKYFYGAACAGVLLFLVYVPSGPDECSRALTDTQYEECLEDIFIQLTIEGTRNWLESHGYRVTTVFNSTSSGTAGNEMYLRKGRARQHNLHFQAIRNHGRWRSIPYGTNFNRLFARIGPAPEHFEMYLYGQRDNDVVFGVKVNWAFSFL